MVYYLMFAAAGYLCGSVMFAPIFGRLLKNRDIIEGTKDKNPGTANAFTQGGMLCGCLTLVCELAKGFLPVFACLYFEKSAWVSQELWRTLGLALVLLAPVMGHAFPLFFRFRGGKGIAATFGSLLGLAPDLYPALTLAFFFLLFSLVIRITPHFYRTLGTYIFAAFGMLVGGYPAAVKIGFLAITLLVCWKLHRSEEPREECKVRLLWMH